MSRLKALHIPKEIMELPCVRTAQVYNAHGNLINLQSVNTVFRDSHLAYNIELMRSADQFGPLHVAELDKDTLLNIREKSWQFGITHYHAAKLAQTKPNLSYAFAALTGLTAANLAIYASIKETGINNLPTCVTMVQLPCNSKEEVKAQNALRQEFAMSGVGAVLLAAATILAVRLARRQTQQPKNDFVKAALAIGNVDTCDRWLDGMVAPEPVQQPA